MDDEKRILLQKLADAYETGWEYREDDGEAGSVLAQVVLSLSDLNEKRFGRIWEKHKREFLHLAPEPLKQAACLEGMAAVLAVDGRDGFVLPEKTLFTAVTGNSEILYFETQESRLLSAAVLEKAYFETGGCVYRVYDREQQEDLSFSLFKEEGEKVESLKLHWSYTNLCNGLGHVDWEAEFTGTGEFTEVCRFCADGDRARFTVTDGESEYVLTADCDGEEAPAADRLRLSADTPDFAGNLQDTVYDIWLEVLDPHEGKKLVGRLTGFGLNLTERGGTWKPQLFLTDLLETADEEVLPFTEEPDAYACCYIGCDGAFARTEGEISIHFQEDCRVEEVLPAEKPEEYKKKMKKYAWMLPEEKVLDWQCAETIWEYYNGAGWRPLPGSGDWNTGCVREARQVRHSFQRPEDMQACVMEGEEHYYLRLRLVRVQDAFAQFYHKYIPVLSQVSFTCPPRQFVVENMDIMTGGLEKEMEDRMYFAFSHTLPPQMYVELTNEKAERVYKGVWGNGLDIGWKELFGHFGYWVTVRQQALLKGMQIRGERTGSGTYRTGRTESGEMSGSMERGMGRGDFGGLRKQRGKGEESEERLVLSGLWCNPVRVRQIFVEEEEEEHSAEEITEGMLLSPGEGYDGLAAQALENFYLSGESCAQPDPVMAAGHFFTCQGRIVNVRDLEKLLKERYFWIDDVHCVMTRDRQLTVTLCGLLQSDRQESLQQEIQGWLEGCLEQMGCWWLQECALTVKIEGPLQKASLGY